MENGSGGGKITISLGPRQYSGRWIYAAVGGGVGFGSTMTKSGKQVSTASATFVDTPTGGNGTVLASASDGSTLRCAFESAVCLQPDLVSAMTVTGKFLTYK